MRRSPHRARAHCGAVAAARATAQRRAPRTVPPPAPPPAASGASRRRTSSSARSRPLSRLMKWPLDQLRCEQRQRSGIEQLHLEAGAAACAAPRPRPSAGANRAAWRRRSDCRCEFRAERGFERGRHVVRRQRQWRLAGAPHAERVAVEHHHRVSGIFRQQRGLAHTARPAPDPRRARTASHWLHQCARDHRHGGAAAVSIALRRPRNAASRYRRQVALRAQRRQLLRLARRSSAAARPRSVSTSLLGTMAATRRPPASLAACASAPTRGALSGWPCCIGEHPAAAFLRSARKLQDEPFRHDYSVPKVLSMGRICPAEIAVQETVQGEPRSANSDHRAQTEVLMTVVPTSRRRRTGAGAGPVRWLALMRTPPWSESSLSCCRWPAVDGGCCCTRSCR